MLKMAVQQGAASEEARRTLRYVEPLTDVRTPLTDFFSRLLALCVLLYKCLSQLLGSVPPLRQGDNASY